MCSFINNTIVMFCLFYSVEWLLAVCFCVSVCQLKKSLRFTEDDDGVHPVVLGSMVFPPDCYDDENPWTPLTPKNTHSTNTPRMVSLHLLFICPLFPLVHCCLYSQSLLPSFYTFSFWYFSPHFSCLHIAL